MTEELFQYNKGDGEPFFACPFGLDRQIILEFSKLGPTEADAWKLFKSENPVQTAQGAEIICKVSRAAFALVPFNGRTGEGASEAMAFDTFLKFREWGNQKKTTPAPTQTSPPSSELPPKAEPVGTVSG